MYIHDATEQAYKNGYTKGYEEGKSASVVHAKWGAPKLINGHWYRTCSNCLYSSAHGAADNKEFKTNFCSNCGAIADLK